ncbi:MAG: 2-iminoacetate synthase ThiH [Elusimicrobia bacterium HGW-Elusimicrobia-1]|jgi:2-iminoacetate synthase|nr:MAG: 2-iminoacetate synthase ThiH [Elusimicrobia bacterium HGW-Elusimicrobia-3]PKN01841.1 MAG: 2-iminoacetate synthase ThiH [Elusimicrobia bacterium HGW-Elusimicrobia-1]
MSFLAEFRKQDSKAVAAKIYSATPSDVRRALAAEFPSVGDFLALLSPAARAFAGETAVRARELTISHFGKNINLYAPLYLSNECDNACRYCGFNASSSVGRKTLSDDEILREADSLKARGFDNVLLLTGESPSKAGSGYVEKSVRMLSEKFTFTGLEIFPADSDVYRRFVSAGASGLTVYQETYDEKVYEYMHPAGKKRDFEFRIQSPERALEAGFRRVGLGALLGLSDWRLDAAMLGLHAKYLIDKYWRGDVTISFPRLKKCASGFNAPHPVSDGDVASMIFALRIFLPRAGMILSTRESDAFRDSLIGWGITMMSAGSRTNPGGYASGGDAREQFEVSDRRSVDEVVRAIERKGFYAVFKDWDRGFGASRYD